MQIVYCRLLAVGGLLEERGDEAQPIHYIPTKRGEEVYRDVWSYELI